MAAPFRSPGGPPPSRASNRHAILADLLPGVAQWRWSQRDRGLVLLGSFLATLMMSVFCWGTVLGWAFLGLAFLTHLASSIDVLRQLAFPVFRPLVAVSASALSLAAAVYLPIAVSLFLVAYPARSSDLGARYLVNLLAYRTATPCRGEWVWFRHSPQQPDRAGRVLATEGQEVEWTGRRWKIDGLDVPAHPGMLPYYPEGWRFSIPRGHLLVSQEASGNESTDSSPILIVGRDQIIGRAWIKCYPFWERSLL
ncbi:S26 family signal peptidase [Aquisphaera insulae]|uniref:S26 family signal peptidase n=1 Tax=Aquisphaera insulae TaxID=2712864 RepID=UPI0013ED5984|nr:S26 family signal peptidase [Aquisphaera insulae]